MLEHTALRIGDHLVARPAVHGELVGPELLLTLGDGKQVGHLHRGERADGIGRGEVGLPHLVNANKSFEQRFRTVRLRHVPADGVGGKAPRHEARADGRIHARRRPDLRGGNPRDLGDLLGRIGLHRFFELVEAVRPLLHELLVVKLLVDDDVHPTERKRAVGAGAQAQPYVGTGRILGAAGIDHDDLRIGIVGEQLAVAPMLRKIAALGGVAAPEHDALGVRCRRGRSELAERCAFNRIGGAPAHLGAAHGNVGTAVLVEEARDIPFVGTSGAMREHDRFRSVLVGKPAQLGTDLLACLIPRDLLPLARSARADSLERVVQALRVVKPLELKPHALAHLALVDGTLRIAFDLRCFAIFNGDEHPAVRMAAEAQRFLQFYV